MGQGRWASRAQGLGTRGLEDPGFVNPHGGPRGSMGPGDPSRVPLRVGISESDRPNDQDDQKTIILRGQYGAPGVTYKMTPPRGGPRGPWSPWGHIGLEPLNTPPRGGP